jgi:hypothetical protein
MKELLQCLLFIALPAAIIIYAWAWFGSREVANAEDDIVPPHCQKKVGDRP